MTTDWRALRRAGGVFLACAVAASATAAPSAWVELGPAPATSGQVEGISAPLVNPVAGAIHALAPHPTDAAVLYVGAVNGGVWRTTNATAAFPAWTRLTDAQLSNAIADVAFDPTDATHNTLVAGVGRYSSFAGRGGARVGVLRTTDGGSTWTALTNNLGGRNVSSVVARGATILAGVDVADVFSCANVGLFRSTDTGATFTKLAPASGLPGGGVDTMATDPSNNAVVYASLALAGACAGNPALNGIYKSTDTGATWAKVSNATMDALFDATSTSGDNVRIATAPGNVVVVAIARGTLRGVFHSANGGGSFSTISPLPTTPDQLVGGNPPGIHPGQQGSLHLSLAVDPANTNIVYLGGDRQPLSAAGTFPNSSNAFDFSGRLFRGDVTVPGTTTWVALTHTGAANNSSPHADSREMRFDANGRLLEVDDGGVYARLSPTLASGGWISLNGDLQVNEQHSATFDPVANVALSGNQDTGTTRQVAPGNRTWASLHTGDGGDVAVDTLFLAAQNRSVAYSSFQNLAVFRRRVQDTGNIAISQEFPALVVTTGPALTAQFTTPVVANAVAGGRVVIGGANALYESLDRGDTISEVASGIANVGVRAASTGADAIAYGAVGNASVLYVGGCRVDHTAAGAGFPCLANTNGVFLRTAAGGNLALSYTARAGSTIHGVALDPDDPAHAFATETPTGALAARVLRTDDTGAAWDDVTGNIAASAGTVRSVLYVPHATNDLVVVGTETGVLATSRQRGFALWSALGTGFPRVPVYDLSYDPTRDLLHAGTLGRGSLALASIAAAPVAANDAAVTPRNTAVQVAVLANDTDTGGTVDASTVSIATPPPSGAATSIDPGTGAITYTPPAGFTGTEVFAYRVRDDLGTMSNVALVTVRVNAPPVAANDSVVTQRNTAVPILVLANDSDADGTLASATLAIASPPASGTAVAAAGTVTYTPAAGVTGTFTFTYTVADNDGAVSNAATVTVRVNAPPTAANDSAFTVRNAAVSLNVLANDGDADGTIVTLVNFVGGSGPSNGSVIATGGGNVTYTPAAGFSGTDSFQYRAEDNDGALSPPATVTIRVNAPPAAVADAVVTQRDTAIPVAVLANDADADGTLVAASVVVTSAPASGTAIAAASGIVTYTPPGGFTGTVTFAYTVADNEGTASAPATVTVRVNALPVAVADAANASVGTPQPIAVLSNDSDADGTLDAATVEISTAPSAGSVAVAPTGVVTFTPPAVEGAVTFAYRVRDNDGAQSNPATVTVTVVANVAPVAVDDAIAVATGGTATTLVGGATSLVANDTDANADTLVVTVTPVSAPTRGTLTLASNGTFSYVHGGSAFGYDEFTYQACDGRGGCDTARVAIRIGDLLHRDGFE